MYTNVRKGVIIKNSGSRKAYRVDVIFNSSQMNKEKQTAGLPSTTGNPSGKGRDNYPPKPKR